MNLSTTIKQEFLEAQVILERFIADSQNMESIGQAAILMAHCIREGNKIISCGNGGSHCDAMHFAEELTGRYRQNRQPLPAIAISDPAHISCVGNDFGYAEVFSRYIEAIGQPGDTLLAISTSGQSENIYKAVEAAKAKGMKVIVLTGKNGGKLRGHADIEICVDHSGFADRIQEIHIKIIHTLILSIEKLVIHNSIPLTSD